MKITNCCARKYSKLYNSGPFVVWISYSLETDILTGLERARTLHCTLKSTQGVSLHSTSSPCLQGDLPKLCQHAADLFTSEAILSAYPDPSSRDSGMQKTPGGLDYQDPEHPDIGSILAINQARPHDGHTPLLTPDTEPITGLQGNIIAE